VPLVGRDRCRHGRVTAAHEASQPAFDVTPLDEDMAPACATAESDVGPETIDEPLGSSARVRTAEPKDVA
jgi:hypothetical protein